MCEECGCGEKTALVCAVCGGRMVLINDVPVCTACGARGNSAADVHEHHGHAHSHHGEQPRSGPDDLTRLRILLPHWLEHNEEHLHDLRAWAAKARELRREAAAELIGIAIEHMEACNEALDEAMGALE